MQPAMSLSKQRISSPLEAGQSILDVHSLPPKLTEALDYASRKLERKALHVTLLVVRKTYQVPGSVPPTPTSPEPSPALASPSSWLASPVKSGLRSLRVVRRGTGGSSSSSSLTLESSNQSNSIPSPALHSAASLDAGPNSPRRFWPPTPGSPPVAMTPRTPMTPGTPSSIFTAITPSLHSPLSTPPLSAASSSFFSSKPQHRSTNSSNTTATASTSKASDNHNESELAGIRLVYAEPLSVRSEKVLRSTLQKAASKFGLLAQTPPTPTSSLPTAWYNPTAPSALGLHAGDLIRQSLLQNEVLYSSEAISILAFDRLYTFKAALSTYSRAVSTPRTRPTTLPVASMLEDAVDELRRLILARALRPVGRPELLRSYDFVGAVGPRALAEVETMYRRAYGGDPVTPLSGGKSSLLSAGGKSTLEEEEREDGGGEGNVVYEKNEEAKKVTISSGPAMSRARSFMVTADCRARKPLTSQRFTRSDNNLRGGATGPLPKRTEGQISKLAERPEVEEAGEERKQGQQQEEDPTPRSISRSSARTVEPRFVKIGTPPPPKSTTPVVLPKLDTTVAAAGRFKTAAAAHTNGPQVMRPKPTKTAITSNPHMQSAGSETSRSPPEVMRPMAMKPAAADNSTAPPAPMGDNWLPIRIEADEGGRDSFENDNHGGDHYTHRPKTTKNETPPRSIGWPATIIPHPPQQQQQQQHRQPSIGVGHPFSIDEMMLHDKDNNKDWEFQTHNDHRHGDETSYEESSTKTPVVAGGSGAQSRSSISSYRRWGNSIRFSNNHHLHSQQQRVSHLGPQTPNGYDDISPITRGEWGFLFSGDTFTKTKTAAVETC